MASDAARCFVSRPPDGVVDIILRARNVNSETITRARNEDAGIILRARNENGAALMQAQEFFSWAGCLRRAGACFCSQAASLAASETAWRRRRSLFRRPFLPFVTRLRMPIRMPQRHPRSRN